MFFIKVFIHIDALNYLKTLIKTPESERSDFFWRGNKLGKIILQKLYKMKKLYKN